VVIVSDEEHPIELMPEGAASRVRIYKSLDSIEDYIDELVRDIQEFLLLA
jgi:hypothetical protein